MSRWWCTPAEAAESLGCTPRTVRNRAAAGEIRAKRTDSGRWSIFRPGLPVKRVGEVQVFRSGRRRRKLLYGYKKPSPLLLYGKQEGRHGGAGARFARKQFSEKSITEWAACLVRKEKLRARRVRQENRSKPVSWDGQDRTRGVVIPWWPDERSESIRENQFPVSARQKTQTVTARDCDTAVCAVIVMASREKQKASPLSRRVGGEADPMQSASAGFLL